MTIKPGISSLSRYCFLLNKKAQTNDVRTIRSMKQNKNDVTIWTNQQAHRNIYWKKEEKKNTQIVVLPVSRSSLIPRVIYNIFMVVIGTDNVVLQIYCMYVPSAVAAPIFCPAGHPRQPRSSSWSQTTDRFNHLHRRRNKSRAADARRRRLLRVQRR